MLCNARLSIVDVVEGTQIGHRQYCLCREGEAPAEPTPARQEPLSPHYGTVGW